MRWIKLLEQKPSDRDLKQFLKESNICVSKAIPSSIYILGAGIEGARLIRECAISGVDVVGVFDSDVTKRGRYIENILIEPFDSLIDKSRQFPIIIASHRTYSSTILLRSLGFHVTNYATLQVLFSECFKAHMFYNELHRDLIVNGHEIINIFNCLEDDNSRKVMNSIIGYRITLDPIQLQGIIDWDLYNFSSYMELNNNETYVDGGSFDGDSIKIFIDQKSGLYKKIYAFEPDPKTFIKLRDNLNGYPDIKMFNKGLFSKSATLQFNDDGSRGAIISEKGNTIIKACKLDDIIPDHSATLIKLNIEGAEIDAIEGALITLKNSKPKLAISLYHRPFDLWKIPKKISDLGLGYKFKISQHDGGIIESVLYAF